jgi:hypothetical protein
MCDDDVMYMRSIVTFLSRSTSMSWLIREGIEVWAAEEQEKADGWWLARDEEEGGGVGSSVMLSLLPMPLLLLLLLVPVDARRSRPVSWGDICR